MKANETKSTICKLFRKLDNYNFQVFSFGDRRPLRTGAKNFCDIVILNHRILCFIEIKTTSTNDKLRGEQEKTAKNLSSIMSINKSVFYFRVNNLLEAKRLQERILKNDL